MTWHCPAIDHGAAIFPDGRIRPCCQTAADYSKPLSMISDSQRFTDLKSQDRPDACSRCWQAEDRGQRSYRQFFIDTASDASGLQFLDFRHSNQCNLKCRYCNPHFSNQWAKELKKQPINLHVDVEPLFKTLLTDSLEEVYWTGGEPLIIRDHYACLDYLIKNDISSGVRLRYNTNGTILDYKDVNVFDLWKNFKQVSVMLSLDAVGDVLDHIRSGSDWSSIEKNIQRFLEYKQTTPNFSLTFTPVISMLNFWFLPDLLTYAKQHHIPVNPIVLQGPDYLSLAAIHRDLKPMARDILSKIQTQINQPIYRQIESMLEREENEYLFAHAIRHILLLDHMRGENLFGSLPFRDVAVDITLRNCEYE